MVARFKDETQKLRTQAGTKYFALYRLALSVNDLEAAGVTLKNYTETTAPIPSVSCPQSLHSFVYRYYHPRPC